MKRRDTVAGLLLPLLAGCRGSQPIMNPPPAPKPVPLADKLDQTLIQVVESVKSKGAAGLRELADRKVVTLTESGQLDIDITADNATSALEAIKKALPALKGEVKAELANHLYVRIPAESLAQLAAMAEVHFVAAPQAVYRPL